MMAKTAKEDGDISLADTQPADQQTQSLIEPIHEILPEPMQEHTANPDLQLREIRELLFGAQVRQVNSDLSTRYKQVTEQISALTRQMEASFARLTSEFNSKLDNLSNHLEDLNRQRITRDDDLSADIDDLRHKLNEARAASEQTDGEIRNELHNEADRLNRELDQRHHEAMHRINQTSEELSNNKTDRKTLAALLGNLANNLAAGEQS
jgi:DNA repair exonuclease SbcCD ATPase subunit